MLPKISYNSKWTFSAGGLPLELYHCLFATEQPILFIGGVHGDEPEGVEMAKGLISWLTEAEKQQNLSKLYSWILIPCLNPDGYSKNERTNANGVDLNRNFPSRDWTDFHDKARYYPGPKPGSEPEIQALIQLINTHKPRLIVHFHSWEPCVVYTGEPGKTSAELLATGTGYKACETIGYPTPGSLGQYGWLEHQTPVICIEEQEKIDLKTVWPRFKHGFELLLTRSK